MFHLVYVSSATRPFAKPELHALLEKCRTNNAELGATGMLLYRDGNFMQLLEGEEEVVTELAAKIALDTRHKDVMILLRGGTTKRLFPEWSMGFCELTDGSISGTPGYSHFLNTPFTGSEFSKNPSKCLNLLLLFKQTM